MAILLLHGVQKPLLLTPQPARYDPVAHGSSDAQLRVGQLSISPPGPVKKASGTGVHGTQLPADEAPQPCRYWPLAHGGRALHRSHAARPVAFWYSPASHRSHTLAPLLGALVPVAHGVGSVLPVGAKKPRSVVVHSAALARLVTFE